MKYFNYFFVKTRVILSGNFPLNEKIKENFKTLCSSSYCEKGKTVSSCNIQLTKLCSRSEVANWNTVQSHTTIKLQRQKFKYFDHKVSRQNSWKRC